MFFKKHEQRSGGIFQIFRILLSIAVFMVLSYGLLQAYQAFSGVDPLKVNPKALVQSKLTPDSIYQLAANLLSFNPVDKLPKNEASPKTEQSTIQFKFAVISDSHKDTQNLSKALNQAKNLGSKFIIGLGDFSDTGTIDELMLAKQEFDKAGLPYYVTAGDHDLWESREKNLPPEDNFRKVFGFPYQAFTVDFVRFIILFNSDNYFGIDPLQADWLGKELEGVSKQNIRRIFVFASTPFSHPSSDHTMGKVNPKLKDQAQHTISILHKNGIDEVFAGDAHLFSRYQESQTGLKMTTVGAVTSERNPQAPRFIMVEVFESGGYNIEDIEIK